MTATIEDRALLKIMPIQRAVAEYLKHCKVAAKLAPSTLTTYKGALTRLVEVCEPGMSTHLLNPMHIQMALTRGKQGESERDHALRLASNPRAVKRKGRAAGSMNIDNSAYRTFVEWCKANAYLSVHARPAYNLKNASKGEEETRRSEKRWIVPYDQRANYLDIAGARHERDRAVAAFGLFGGRRFSDLTNMRVRDIDLENERFSFVNKKGGGQRVTLPYNIWPEFAVEVRLWMAQLMKHFGLLDPDWYLFPARLTINHFAGITATNQRLGRGHPMDPTKPASRTSVHKDARYALECIGAPSLVGAGHHWLRHSCANWLESDQGWTREHIRQWLQHRSQTTTDIYLSKGDTAKLLLEQYGRGPVPTDERERVSVGERRKFHLELVADLDDDEDAA